MCDNHISNQIYLINKNNEGKIKVMKKEVSQVYRNWLDNVLEFDGLPEGFDINQLKNRLANDLAERKLNQNKK